MKRNLLCFLLLIPVYALGVNNVNDKLFYNYIFAPSEGFVNKIENSYREEVCLNGYWDFQPVPLPESFEYGKGIAPDLNMPESDKWSNSKIKIPSPWNINGFSADSINNIFLPGPDYRSYPSYPKEWDSVMMAWMRKTVKIPKKWGNKLIKLHFEAIAGNSVIYVNGEKIGENFDSFLPFEFDITDKVIPGKNVEILVGVRNYALFDDISTVGRRIIPAGSMWGKYISGIWQDVYLFSKPKINISNVYVKPLVSKNNLELNIDIENCSKNKIDFFVEANINKWNNLAGKDINLAPVPSWELGELVLSSKSDKYTIAANDTCNISITIPVNGELKYWTPETPNLYSVLLNLKTNDSNLDLKYERFGWREWSINGSSYCLNGEPYEFRGDSWHFTGIPQMTRRYAWAWFTAIKGMNGNAVRLHAQVFPRFYLDMADEMGICVLEETANWASDGGPKLDSDFFWRISKEHLIRLILRDRNYASVFGWSLSNENKPIILNVFNKPQLMDLQNNAWKEWRDIVRSLDSTRPWISSDGDGDGNGMLPIAIGHYGGEKEMNSLVALGKPWGIGEHSKAYFGTPEQVSQFNGERSYESQQGRMEGIANECYNLILNQRKLGASYTSVFNMVWYALKPLPLGKKCISKKTNINDGVFFSDYKEGIPGVQPERIGPYSTTLNPGYDPSLPLYDPWPMYDAIRAANNHLGPSWSPFANFVNKENILKYNQLPVEKTYEEIIFIGDECSKLKKIMDTHGVIFKSKISKPLEALYIIDGSCTFPNSVVKQIKNDMLLGADLWIWGIIPGTESFYNTILPKPVVVDSLVRSSFIPQQKSWFKGLHNSDFYFCELQKTDVVKYSLKGKLIEDGEVLLNACKTDWRMWNQCPEILKTASIIRSEHECVASTAVFVRYNIFNSCIYVSTLDEFSNSDKGYKTLSKILDNAGIPRIKKTQKSEDMFFIRDNQLMFPISTKNRFTKNGPENEYVLEFNIYSPRALNDLLIEPDIPKLMLFLNLKKCVLYLNDKFIEPNSIKNNKILYDELPLVQGWNKITIKTEKVKNNFEAFFKSYNRPDFIQLLKINLK